MANNNIPSRVEGEIGDIMFLGKARIQDCFDKAKVLGARSKALNRRFR